MKRLILNALDYIKPFYIGNFIKKNINHSFLWITSESINHEQVLSFIKYFVPNIETLQIPKLDTQYNELIKPSKNIVFERINTLYKIFHKKNPILVLIDEESIKQTTLSPSSLTFGIIKVTESVEIIDLPKQLSSIGYERVPDVTAQGEFAVRGDIVDIFCDKPYRISLFGTMVEKIKEFDPSSKLTYGPTIRDISIFPITEMLDSMTTSISSWFSLEYIVFKDDEYEIDLPHENICSFSHLSDKSTDWRKISLNYKDYVLNQDNSNVIDSIKETIQNANKKIILATANTILAKRLSNILNLKTTLHYDDLTNVSIGLFDTAESFETENFIIISCGNIFKEHHTRRNTRIKKEDLLKDINSLSEGDFVVHIKHGIGQFVKLVTLEVNKRHHDFLQILYDGDEKLFLPVENINLLSRYGDQNATVQLDKLGSKSWSKRKEKIKAKIFALADELIKTAASRELVKVEPIEWNTPEFEKFANNFEYVETPDQNTVIQEVLLDLGSGRLVDRLICGDVGFGKTEVAMRAAFAVCMTKQVAVVVPTTILCQQHYDSFVKRFNGFPVKIAMLSRNSTNSQLKRNIENGDVDIIIGTHALFKQKFKSLGLLIIDEEQHFGVKQKETLKKNNPFMHILTLTATPIPRTLQMSISGIKDISIISTPPIERLSSRGVITEYDEEILKEAIEREISRNGQIFYICPHIANIKDVEEGLLSIAPKVPYRILHGKMPHHEIEQAMIDFKNNKFKILVSTAIVESGIDIKNANTMIVHNAHMFGLASLYQLKGRIGRSNIKGFAYFILPKKKEVSKNAYKRLHVLQNLEKLGAGFSLSSYDMDIRGAGNILGEEQSGHIKEIGVELYQKMLKNAIEKTSEEQDIRINLNIPVLIPLTYINSEDDRITYYQRIANCGSKEDLYIIKKEMEDYFGKLPSEVLNLMYVVDIRRRCKACGIIGIDAGSKGTIISFSTPTNIEKILALCTGPNSQVEIKPDNKVILKKGMKLQEFISIISSKE